MIEFTYPSGIRRFLTPFAILLAVSLAMPAWGQGNIRHQMLVNEARSGDVEAQYRLGSNYASGFGVAENLTEAAKWYRKAAEQGMAVAQKNLAELYASGRGVKRDYVEAYKWYEISLPNLLDVLGRTMLRVEQDALAKKMTPEDLAEARKLAAAWIGAYRIRTGKGPLPEDPSATGNVDPSTEQNWSCDKPPVRGDTPKLWLNPCLLVLPAGQWTMIHEQKRGDAVRFPLQSHGGSAFDTRRGRIVLFGSDTHDAQFRKEILINTPLIFDVAKLRWMRLYPSDPPRTYAVTQSGIPVAGYARNHPWAMHTYGAVEYDRKRDEIVVSSHPQHLEPGRFVDTVAHLWPHIKFHPTWVFSFRTNRWAFLNATPQSFFRFSTAYDTDRGTVIGYRSDGVFELGGRQRRWRQVSRRGALGGHSNSVYDSKHKAVIVFGGGYDTGNSNDVVAFWPGTARHRVMPTPGLRPRADTHVPMAYHPEQERTVALIDEDAYLLTARIAQHSTAQTWLYDLGKDKWTVMESGRLPLGLGMNYNMVYDPGHKILLLVAKGGGGNTTVWALRL